MRLLQRSVFSSQASLRCARSFLYAGTQRKQLPRTGSVPASGASARRPSSQASVEQAASNMPAGEEVEVKLRLADQAAHDKLVELLKADQTHLYRQHNLFYDGPNRELSSQRTVLRVRWFNEDEKVVITVKGKMAVTDGVGRAAEDEDEVPVDTAREFEGDPNKILQVDLPVIKSLKERININSLVPLGGFKNIRKVVPWRGETLEIDETRYDWGTVHEIECETKDPEGVRSKLSDFLKENGIDFKYNTSTKFQNFINKTLE